MRRAVKALLASVAVAVAVLVPASPATAARNVRYGIHDDAWLAYGPGSLADRVTTLDRLGVDLVRFTIRWDVVAPRKPEKAMSNADPAYDWALTDSVLGELRKHGIGPVVTLVGTPGWANGGQPSAYAPLKGSDFSAFAYAAASRYPWVRYWTIWNEPNQRRWLRPNTPETYVQKLLNPAYFAIHRASRQARVGGGMSAPRGNVGGLSPVAWIRGMAVARARLDAYAHHPYPASSAETPFKGGCDHCDAITMANLPRLLREVGRYFPRKPIWLTEFGYQTNPPDPILGVTPALQARYLSEASWRVFGAPRVEMLIQYLYQDEPELGRFQSGLVSASGTAKPALQAFPLPLVQTRRRGAKAFLWGQVRPRKGPQRYRIQIISRGRAHWAGRVLRTSSAGFFAASVTAPRGAFVRVLSPADGFFSPRLKLR
jgi:hypothetical protein